MELKAFLPLLSNFLSWPFLIPKWFSLSFSLSLSLFLCLSFSLFFLSLSLLLKCLILQLISHAMFFSSKTLLLLSLSFSYFNPLLHVHTSLSLSLIPIPLSRYPWNSLVEGGGGSYLPNCQTNLVIALYALSLLFWHFIYTTAYHLGRYKLSSPVSCHAPALTVTWVREWSYKKRTKN